MCSRHCRAAQRAKSAEVLFNQAYPSKHLDALLTHTPGRPNLVSLSRTFGSVGDTSEQILDSKTPLPQFPREEEASATDPRKGDPLDTAADMQNLMQPSGSDGSGGDTKPTTASHGGDPEKQPKGEEITAVKEEVDWSDLDQDKETTTPPRIKGDKSDRSWRDLPENKGGANNHVPQSWLLELDDVEGTAEGETATRFMMELEDKWPSKQALPSSFSGHEHRGPETGVGNVVSVIRATLSHSYRGRRRTSRESGH